MKGKIYIIILYKCKGGGIEVVAVCVVGGILRQAQYTNQGVKFYWNTRQGGKSDAY